MTIEMCHTVEASAHHTLTTYYVYNTNWDGGGDGSVDERGYKKFYGNVILTTKDRQEAVDFIAAGYTEGAKASNVIDFMGFPHLRARAQARSYKQGKQYDTVQ